MDYNKVFVRNNYECLILLWNNEPGADTTDIILPVQTYIYPVSISLFNYRKCTDLPYRLESGNRLVIPDVSVGQDPVIIRLVAERPL